MTALEVHDHLPGTLARLIDDLIEFSRLSRSELRRTLVDMDRVVRDASAQVQRDEPSRQIAWLFEPLPDAFADDGVLRLVWTNLLDNAIRYTSPHLRARIEIGGRRERDEAVLWVRDNGVGFDPASAEKSFGVFRRLHQTDELGGRGIGLATVQQVIAWLGGRA